MAQLGNRVAVSCQALAPALEEKPLQHLILSGNDCGAKGAKAVGLPNGGNFIFALIMVIEIVIAESLHIANKNMKHQGAGGGLPIR